METSTNLKTPTDLNKNPANYRELGDVENSAVDWPTIIAGAFTIAAVLLVLLLLGSGLGFASVSPWLNSGVSIATFTGVTVIWCIAMQFIASGLGGYMTGRLRSRWINMHTDEVFFRDTAHGFLAWALATIITAAFLASAASSVISSSVKATTTVAASAVAGVGYGAAKNSGDIMNDPMGYFVDILYRSDNSNPSEGGLRSETMHILVTGLKEGGISNADKAHLTQLVSAHTDLNQEDASRRVNDVVANLISAKETAKEGLNEARKTAMKVSLYTFLSMLIGAFIASAFAALGGKHRDSVG